MDKIDFNEVRRLEEFIRHHENKFWYGLVFFITIHSILIGAFFNAEEFAFRIAISIFGILFSVFNLFFVRDLRRYWGVYRKYYQDEIKIQRDSTFLKVEKELKKSKFMSQHFFIIFLISVVLGIWIYFLSHLYDIDKLFAKLIL